MASSGARRVTSALADTTGRSDDELRLALAVAGLVAALMVGVRIIDWLANLGQAFRRRSG